ncbi:MAG: acyl-CoA thioesterase [Bacteroidota bacterium]
MNIEKKFLHHTDIQIRFNDIDLIGHVNNAVYQHFFDLARKKYFEEVIGTQLEWKEFGVVMASICIEYYHAITINEKISVRSGIEVIGDKSLTMVQEMYNRETEQLKSQNRAVLVGYSTNKAQTVVIPSLWKDKIYDFESQIEFKHPV